MAAPSSTVTAADEARPWSTVVTLGALVHTEAPDVVHPTAEPTSAVSLQIVRCDGIEADGHVVPGDPELVVAVAGEHVPLTLADVDVLLARVHAARARMVSASPDLPARTGHRAGTESP